MTLKCLFLFSGFFSVLRGTLCRHVWLFALPFSVLPSQRGRSRSCLNEPLETDAHTDRKQDHEPVDETVAGRLPKELEDLSEEVCRGDASRPVLSSVQMCSENASPAYYPTSVPPSPRRLRSNEF